MEQEKRNHTFAIIGVGAIVALVIFLLSFHIVFYSGGTTIIAKDHLTFSDTIIDVDKFLKDYNESDILQRARKAHIVGELEKKKLIERKTGTD